MIKLPHFHNNFVPVQVLKILFPSINEGISYKIALGLCPQTPQLYLQQTKLVSQCLALALIFPGMQ